MTRAADLFIAAASALGLLFLLGFIDGMDRARIAAEREAQMVSLDRAREAQCAGPRDGEYLISYVERDALGQWYRACDYVRGTWGPLARVERRSAM